MTDLETDDTVTDKASDDGVKRVGAHAAADPVPLATKRSRRAVRAAATERKDDRVFLTILATLGLLGTIVFGVLYFTKSSSSGLVQDPTAVTAARTFLTDFFNFDAKSIDSDFSALTNMATGSFSTQANQFFNSAIRQDLEKALADSRGQIRALEVQSENPAQTTASVYAVVDQVYVNNKITTPQSDVVRIIVNLQKVKTVWKISNVTVLEGATPASAGTSSGTAGSNVPGQ